MAVVAVVEVDFGAIRVSLGLWQTCSPAQSTVNLGVKPDRRLAVVDNRGIIVDHLGIRTREPCSVRPSDLIQGTLDVLILKSLASEPRHGWAIAKRIQAVSGDVLQIKQGSLYPALHRLEAQGLIKAE